MKSHWVQLELAQNLRAGKVWSALCNAISEAQQRMKEGLGCTRNRCASESLKVKNVEDFWTPRLVDAGCFFATVFQQRTQMWHPAINQGFHLIVHRGSGFWLDLTCVTIHFIKHLRMFPGIKCQPSTKKTLHKRRSHAFHLTLFVDQGWTREELNPEVKCQGQVSPLRHIAVTIFPKEDTNLTQIMKGWILHRFNCISWLRMLSSKQVWSCTNVHISKAYLFLCCPRGQMMSNEVTHWFGGDFWFR